MNIQPYTKLDINALIRLEGNLKEYSRKNFDQSIQYHIGHKSKNVYVSVGEGGIVIVLWKLLEQKIDDLTIARQIVGHWLLGERAKTQDISWGRRHDRQIEDEEIRLFFQGDKESLTKYREINKGSSDEKPTCEWKILYYPLEIVKQRFETNLLDEIDEDISVFINGSSPIIMLAYGVVSQQHHQRTDKSRLIEDCRSFLIEKGFEGGFSMEGKDWSRNGEPIMVWISKNQREGIPFRGAVGINFGYDNGLSGYRYAIGIHMPTEVITLPYITRAIFTKRIDADEEFKGVVDSVFKSWIHLTGFGSIEMKFKEFIDKYYSIILESLSRQIEFAKMKKYTLGQSGRLIQNTHSTEFVDYRDALIRLHEANVKEYGPTAFNHFVTWLQLAKEIEGDLNKRTRAEFVASCILGNS